MCPQIIINGKWSNNIARRYPHLETLGRLQINLWNAKDILSSEELLFFLILHLKNKKATCFFLSASGNAHSFYCLYFRRAPQRLTLLEHLASGTESNVPWSRGAIIAVSLWAGSLLKVLIQVRLKSSPEVVKKSNCKCAAHKITFICFEVHLRSVFHSTVLYC